MEAFAPSRSQPALLIKQINSSTIAVRFKDIGPHYRFMSILKRFRFDFLLADCKEMDRVGWWLIAEIQRDALVDFARRNGLKIVEEQ